HTHTDTLAHRHTLGHIQIHTRTRTHTHIHIHIHTQSHSLTLKYTHTHTHTHRYTQQHTHTHTNTHSEMSVLAAYDCVFQLSWFIIVSDIARSNYDVLNNTNTHITK